MKKKRKWVYVQSPGTYDVFCDLCGNKDVEWSEYQGLVWCWRCLKNTKGTAGIFGGPIPVELTKMLGISFDRIDIKTGRRYSIIDT